MPLTVLTDNDVKELLLKLTKKDIEEMHENLGEALHSYSTGDTNSNSSCCSSYQPARTKIRRNGVTTLFMPASTGDAVGMKIVSLAGGVEESDLKSIKSKKSVSSTTNSMSDLTISPATTLDSTTSSVSGSSFAPPASIASTQSTAPRGTLTILDTTGVPTGILNAEELTAFRTALASTKLFMKRTKVDTVTVFGAGRQAYWHIRLALLLRHEEIKHIDIINRGFERAIRLMKKFGGFCEQEYPEWRHVKFSVLSPEFGEYGRLLKEQIRKADVIFCTTPSTSPLFPHEFLTSHEGSKKGRYIAAIGSYAPHMVEIDPEILRKAVAPEHHHHHHKHANRGGVVVVDSLESCLKEAGEIIQAKLKPDQIVELGELLIVKKASLKDIAAGGQGEKGLLEWLQRGQVLYKSVGLGLMDLVVGSDLVVRARERDIGTTIADF